MRVSTFVAPKGEGKSTLVAQWAAKLPHMTLVDVGTSENLDDAVRSVAAEMRYDMQYSEKERAGVASGLTLPEPKRAAGRGAFPRAAVNDFACEQLASAGALRGRYSILILEQATRPLYGPAGRTGGSPLQGGNLLRLCCSCCKLLQSLPLVLHLCGRDGSLVGALSVCEWTF
jgi:hypothetical protein